MPAERGGYGDWYRLPSALERGLQLASGPFRPPGGGEIRRDTARGLMATRERPTVAARRAPDPAVLCSRLSPAPRRRSSSCDPSSAQRRLAWSRSTGRYAAGRGDVCGPAQACVEQRTIGGEQQRGRQRSLERLGLEQAIERAKRIAFVRAGCAEGSAIAPTCRGACGRRWREAQARPRGPACAAASPAPRPRSRRMRASSQPPDVGEHSAIDQHGAAAGKEQRLFLGRHLAAGHSVLQLKALGLEIHGAFHEIDGRVPDQSRM